MSKKITKIKNEKVSIRAVGEKIRPITFTNNLVVPNDDGLFWQNGIRHFGAFINDAILLNLGDRCKLTTNFYDKLFIGSGYIFFDDLLFKIEASEIPNLDLTKSDKYYLFLTYDLNSGFSDFLILAGGEGTSQTVLPLGSFRIFHQDQFSWILGDIPTRIGIVRQSDDAIQFVGATNKIGPTNKYKTATQIYFKIETPEVISTLINASSNNQFGLETVVSEIITSSEDWLLKIEDVDYSGESLSSNVLALDNVLFAGKNPLAFPKHGPVLPENVENGYSDWQFPHGRLSGHHLLYIKFKLFHLSKTYYFSQTCFLDPTDWNTYHNFINIFDITGFDEYVSITFWGAVGKVLITTETLLSEDVFIISASSDKIIGYDPYQRNFGTSFSFTKTELFNSSWIMLSVKSYPLEGSMNFSHKTILLDEFKLINLAKNSETLLIKYNQFGLHMIIEFTESSSDVFTLKNITPNDPEIDHVWTALLIKN